MSVLLFYSSDMKDVWSKTNFGCQGLPQNGEKQHEQQKDVKNRPINSTNLFYTYTVKTH